MVGMDGMEGVNGTEPLRADEARGDRSGRDWDWDWVAIFELDDGRTRLVTLTDGAEIGSAEGSHIEVADRSVSRRHAIFTLGRNGEAWLRDCHSTNGTRVDGVPVGERPHPAREGDVVELGRTRFVLARALHLRSGRLVRMASLSGASSLAHATFARIAHSARASHPVLLLGETGTGKERAASALHALSARRACPFVPINCAALPVSVAESELFGAQRGAYTGADKDRVGAFERAHGGTLFLDEVGELPLAVQGILLRALESGEIQAVGGRSRRVDVRVVAATNRDLPQEVAAGRFRADLFHRLSVLPVLLPSLAQRADAAVLAEEIAANLDPPRHVTRGARALLALHPWPGNLRELRNTLQRADLAGTGPDIDEDAVRLALAPPLFATRAVRVDRPSESIARGRWLRELLDRSSGTAEAWRRSGLPKTTFFRYLRELRATELGTAACGVA